MSKYIKRTEKSVMDGFLERVEVYIEVKLKKCPFCGTAAKTVLEYDDNNEDLHRIHCPKCKITTEPSCKLEDVVEAWNARV